MSGGGIKRAGVHARAVPCSAVQSHARAMEGPVQNVTGFSVHLLAPGEGCCGTGSRDQHAGLPTPQVQGGQQPAAICSRLSPTPSCWPQPAQPLPMLCSPGHDR